MNNLIIRKGLKKDVDSIVSINRENWLLVYPNQELGITKEDVENFLDSIKVEQELVLVHKIEEGNYLIAEFKEKVVGYCRYKEVEPGIFELKTMYIDPKFQSLGIGTSLFNQLSKELKDRKELFLFVAEYNKQAISFYKKIGFIKSFERKKIQIGDDKFISNIKMVYGK